MIAATVGTLTAILTIIWMTPWLDGMVGNWYASFAVAACVAGCLIYFFRGVDILIYQAHDNPPAFAVPFDVITTLDRLVQLLKAAHRGPQYWQIRESVLDAGRVVASLSYTEFYEGIFGHPVQFVRSILLTATVSELPADHKFSEVEMLLKDRWEAEQGKGPWSLVTLVWEVDSALTRSSCSQTIDFMMNEIKGVLGYIKTEPKKESPLIPPVWLLVALACAGYNALECSNKNQGKIEARRQAIERRQELLQDIKPQDTRQDAVGAGLQASPVGPEPVINQGQPTQQDVWAQQRMRIEEYKRQQREAQGAQQTQDVVPANQSSDGVNYKELFRQKLQDHGTDANGGGAQN